MGPSQARGGLLRPRLHPGAPRAAPRVWRRAALLGLLVACAGPRGADRAYTAGLAPVESLSLHVVSARPPRVRVDVSGTLPDACTEIGPVEIQRFPGRVEIALPTRRGFGARCDPAATGYARSVPLVLGVEFPVWTVTVNGVSGRIALPPEALGEPLR